MQVVARPIGLIVKYIYKLLSVADNEVISAYALAIIVSSLILKFVLLPLTRKQTQSMKAMQELNPEIAKLKEKYKNDAETLNRKTMELYKEYNVNPAGGCLPLLIQFPIMIGFFYVLRDPVQYIFGDQATFDAINKSFLWIKDLGYAANALLPTGEINGIGIGTEIPFIGAAVPVLAIIAGVTTYFSSKMTTAQSPAGGSDQQKATQNTMTIMMPFMIFFFALNFPAGLTLYWAISNGFQMAQQYITMHNGKKVLEVKQK
jgi:YidC/Oxa1 family membrane protein insertase